MSLILTGGTIVDGSGSRPFGADLRIVDGRIAAVSTAIQAEADDTVISVPGLILAPGFIDVHTHSDLSRFSYPDAESRITQGVTTEIVGNCGMSPFPLRDVEELREVAGLLDVTMDHAGQWWGEAGDYLDALEAAPGATNVVVLVGHGSVRTAAAPGRGRDVQPAALERMASLVDAALDAGAAGLSLGLMYAPGELAGRDELVALATVVAARAAILSVHLRDYTPDGLIPAMEELLDVAHATGVQLQLSHLRMAGDRERPRLAPALEKLSESPSSVWADAYPYTAGHTTLLQLLPSRLRTLGPDRIATIARTDPDQIATALGGSPYEPEAIWIARAGSDRGPIGRSLAELASGQGLDWRDAAARLIADADGDVEAIIDGAHPDDAVAALQHDRVVVGSDGMALAATHEATGVHPRSFGAFPRVLRLLRARGVPLERAVNRMTGAPAERFSLAGRGILTHGAVADVVAFDPATVSDGAGPDAPTDPPRGIPLVIIDGVPVIRDGRMTGARPGRLLRRDHRGVIA